MWALRFLGWIGRLLARPQSDSAPSLSTLTGGSRPAVAELSVVSSGPSRSQFIIRKFLMTVEKQKGQGEVGGNNAGPYVSKLKRAGVKPGVDLGAWCASGTSWCLEQCLGGPEKTAAYYGVSLAKWNKRRHGAKALFSMLKPLGHTGPNQEPQPGMLALWHRGKAGSWQGHISPVIAVHANGQFSVMHFNRGGYPAIVHESRHCLGEGGLLGFVNIAKPEK